STTPSRTTSNTSPRTRTATAGWAAQASPVRSDSGPARGRARNPPRAAVVLPESPEEVRGNGRSHAAVEGEGERGRRQGEGRRRLLERQRQDRGEGRGQGAQGQGAAGDRKGAQRREEEHTLGGRRPAPTPGRRS